MIEKNKIIFYTTPWCSDCLRSKRLLEKYNIPFTEIDINRDAQAAQLVEKMNNGFRSVPTIVFPDGTYLTEPSNPQLKAKLAALNLIESE